MKRRLILEKETLKNKKILPMIEKKESFQHKCDKCAVLHPKIEKPTNRNQRIECEFFFKIKN